MAIIKGVDIATEATPKFTVSLEGEPSPVKQAIIEYLKPTFNIHTDYGDYPYAPYGESKGSLIIPLLLGLLIWAAIGRH
ncbi:MAG: hypothetical protein HWN68_16630 [Desulfobacterales bacterium]|nr:hypothetical protein [Desulfobacterales bacterium]